MKRSGLCARFFGIASFVFSLLIVLLIARPSRASCANHVDCPAGQTCESGTCVRASTSGPSAPPPKAAGDIARQSETATDTPTSTESQEGPAAEPRDAVPAPVPAAIRQPAPSSQARDQDAEDLSEEFGSPGQVVFWSSGIMLSSTSSGFTDSTSTTSSSNISIAPSLGFFLTDVLILETSANAWRQSDSLSTYYGFGLEAGLGFNFAVGSAVSVVPEIRTGFGFGKKSYSAAASSSTNTSYNFSDYWGSLGAPILFHLAPHFFVGAGPRFALTEYGFSTSSGRTWQAERISLEGMIGGWL